MKRLIAVLSGLLVLPAFAEVAPIYYDDVIEITDDGVASDDVAATVDDDAAAAPQPQPATAQSTTTRNSPRNATINGRVAARAMPSGGTVNPRGTASTRGTTTRSTATVARGAATPNVTTRAAATRTSRAGAVATTQNTVSPRTTQSRSGTQARASIVQTDTVNTPLYTAGRVGTRTSTAVRARIPSVTTTAAPVTAESVATTTASLDELAQITDFCKAQYTQCMDNFCNVLDDNQGRCSCSVNLKNYEKTENALKQATADLQDVAQKIQYIGLSGEEIETLFTQTEAEIKMQNTSDNTKLKNDLDRIKNAIVDVKSGTATTTDTGIGLDLSGLLDLSFSSTGFDLTAFLGTSNNTSSISNQRGEQLYKTATARCKASVLNSCQSQGVDISVITNSYDLEIDKQCIVYERSLNESNDQMASTVRNAKSVLQKARLLVAQQKNAYDLRGCINALDTCMQDDFVCGTDYENCLDSTGKYIVSGDVVTGSQPGPSGGSYTNGTANTGLYATWNYGSNNAWTGNGTLAAFVENFANTPYPIKTATNMADYIKQKIGYIDSDGKVQGMCASVLNKCQDYTYTGNGTARKYQNDNQVVRGYLERILMQIKSAQDEVLAEYGETCLADVSSCLSQNTYNLNNTTGNEISNVAVNACKSVITTCMSVNNINSTADTSINNWLKNALGVTVK